MIIRDYDMADEGDVRVFSANVVWEDRDRPSTRVFYAIRRSDSDLASLNPDSFLIPCAVAANHYQESRVRVERDVCPSLHAGLETALGWLNRWAGSKRRAPALEMGSGCEHPVADPGASAAFLSGGVDSMALLALNHASYPPGHSRRITHAIVVAGIQRNRWMDRESIAEQLAAASGDLAAVVAATDIHLLPVATNIRELNPSTQFWQYEYQGAAMAGIAHVFARAFSHASIASTWTLSHLQNWGSHPVLDPGYGSHSLAIGHELVHLSRLAKTRFLASRPDLLREINVCNGAEAGDQNCGHCEKCLRTMLALEALGELRESPVFTRHVVEPGDLADLRVRDRGLEGEYEELIEPLLDAGRTDLATAITRLLRRCRRRRAVRRLIRNPALVALRNTLRRTLHGAARE